jgi:hypothetical protein
MRMITDLNQQKGATGKFADERWNKGGKNMKEEIE